MLKTITHLGNVHKDKHWRAVHKHARKDFDSYVVECNKPCGKKYSRKERTCSTVRAFKRRREEF